MAEAAADLVREQRCLTGTHLACEHGVCGACTILVDGEPVRGCITLAAAVDGARVDTVEAFADDPLMAIIRTAFSEAHGLQCGFCTPGFLMTLEPFVRDADPARLDDATIREALAGNLCRCTGYQNIVSAVRLAVERRAAG